MIASKKPKNTAYTKTREQDVCDLCRYIRDARQKMQDSPPSEMEPEKVLCVGALNFVFDDEEAQLSEMTALAAKARSGDPVDHWVISWQSDEEPTIQQIHEAARLFAKEMGIEDHQIIYGAHKNTDNVHLHLAINRVHPITEKVVKINKGFDHLAAMRAICLIEHVQGWKQEPNPVFQMTASGPEMRKDRERGLSDAARQAERRTGIESFESRAKALAPIIKTAASWKDLHSQLSKEGVTYEKRKGGAILKFHGPDGKPLGFVKASKSCREASLSALQKRLGTFERSQGPAPAPYEPAPPQIRKDLDLASLLVAVLLSLFGFHAIATQLLYKKQALERYQLRLQKFHSVQAKWAAQGVLKEEHKDQRDSLKAEQDMEIKQVKAMSHSDLIKFSVEKNFLEPEKTQIKEEKNMQKIPGFLKHNPEAAQVEAPEAPALAAFERLHMALKADRYRFTVPHDDKAPLPADATLEEKKAYQKTFAAFSVDKSRRTEAELVIGKTGKLVSPGFTPSELRSGGMKDIVNIYKNPEKGMYMTILSDKVSYITVDDVNTQEKIQKAKQFNFAYVGESSKGNFQGLIKVHSYAEDSNIAYEASLRTVVEINKFCGDPLVHNAFQPLRFPTSHNNKPKHKVDGTGFEVKMHKAEDVFCEHAQEIYNKHVQSIIQEQQQKQKKTELLKDVIEHKPYTRPARTEISLPQGDFSKSGMKYSDWYGTTAAEILIAYDFAKKPRPEGRSLDYEVGIRLRTMGYSQDEVARAICHAHEWHELRNRPPRGDTTWESEAAYGIEQARCAFKTKNADEKVERLSAKKSEFLRKEKKNAKDMQEMYREEGLTIPSEIEIKQETQTRTRTRSR